MAVFLGSNRIESTMASAGLPNIQSLAISQNGTYSVSSSVVGYNPITVEVLPNIQSLSVAQNGTYSVSGSVAGYNPITVNVMPNIQPLTISQSGIYSVSGNVEGFSPVTVNVPGGSLKTIQAYSGIGSVINNNTTTTTAYISGIIFSSITIQPNNFIIALTPQLYHYSVDFGLVPWYVFVSNRPAAAVFNIIYDGVSTTTYAPYPEGLNLGDDIGFAQAEGISTPMSLITWSYNSALQTLTCSLNNNFPIVSWLCFPTAPFSNYDTYPKPAYTIYYN